MKEYNKKLKKLLTVFVIEIVIVVLSFTGYFIYNTNNQEIYLVNGEGDLELNEGLAFFSPSKSYLKLGNLQEFASKDSKVELHYINNQEDKLIYETNSLDYVLISNQKFDDYIDYKNLKNIINNSYLKIINQEDKQEYFIKLNFKKEYI